MNAISNCPFPVAWTPRQIACAVKPRLFELDTALTTIDAGNAANHSRSRTWRSGYAPQSALAPRFRMHG